MERLEGDSFILTGSARECKGRLFETAIRVRDKRRLIPQGLCRKRHIAGAFVLFCDQKSTRKVPLDEVMRGLARGATVERSETGERQIQAPPATASAVRRKPDGRREPAKRGPRPGGPVPLDPQRGGKKPDFTSKITIRRFLRRNPAFSDCIPARLCGRGGWPQGFGCVTNRNVSVCGAAPMYVAKPKTSL